ncbi:MAG: hypothetical protein M5R36_19360 [Deltaproteobacteria bacterium]|nr:hypothetical protein [Deltaproteobacteria bacterium]
MIKLEDIAFPIKAKAMEAFEKNVQKGLEENVRNSWVDASARMLKLYKPTFVDKKFGDASLMTKESFSGASFILETPSPPAGGTTP